MTKVRVHELAKVLETNSKELIALLAEYGYEIKNHMSVLEEDQLDIIFEVFTQKYDKKVEIPNFGKAPVPAPEAPQKKQKKVAEKPIINTPIRVSVARITAEQIAKYRLNSDFFKLCFIFDIYQSSFVSNL